MPDNVGIPNPNTQRPYWQESVRAKYIKPAAVKAELGTNIGWHTFRHTYRSWLDSTGAPVAMQRELMRHASIATTMDVYGGGQRCRTPSVRQTARPATISGPDLVTALWIGEFFLSVRVPTISPFYEHLGDLVALGTLPRYICFAPLGGAA